MAAHTTTALKRETDPVQSNAKTIKVLHIITDLDVGGAEHMLYKLLQCTPNASETAAVISLKDIGPIGEALQDRGIRVQAAQLHKWHAIPGGLWVLSRAILHSGADLVQTWMYHGDLIGGVTARLCTRAPVVWNVRHSDLTQGNYKQSTRLLARACALLSGWIPTSIVCCSQASLETHRAIGYRREKLQVIPNGFDCVAFQPDSQARQELRRELGLDEKTPLVGYVARFHAQKDHKTFFKAAAEVSRHSPQVHFALCGKDITPNNLQLRSIVESLGLSGRVHLLGLRRDVPRLTAAFDIAVSAAAFGEGFPNIIGEAMACAVPCVVSDVGDSAAIVADTGRAVPPADATALAGQIAGILDMPAEARRRLGDKARERVLQHYSLEAVTQSYLTLYRKAIQQVRPAR